MASPNPVAKVEAEDEVRLVPIRAPEEKHPRGQRRYDHDSVDRVSHVAIVSCRWHEPLRRYPTNAPMTKRAMSIRNGNSTLPPLRQRRAEPFAWQRHRAGAPSTSSPPTTSGSSRATRKYPYRVRRRPAPHRLACGGRRSTPSLCLNAFEEDSDPTGRFQRMVPDPLDRGPENLPGHASQRGRE